MTEKLTLMAIFAHPDDEAFGTGGTFAKYAHEDVDVHLVVATLGEAGRVANPTLTLTEPLSILREQELRYACHHYGVKQLHLLRYMDGQTAITPPSVAVYKIVKLLRQLKPQVVISFGPEGIYGHYDHLVIHRWATAAVQLAADAEQWPEAGSPHDVAKFYHRAMLEAQVKYLAQTWGRTAVFMDGIPFPFIGYPLEQITTIIDVRDYVECKLNGIRCHVSQFDPAAPYLQADFDALADPWFWQEAFILAHCHPDIQVTMTNDTKENDLFAGVK